MARRRWSGSPRRRRPASGAWSTRTPGSCRYLPRGDAAGGARQPAHRQPPGAARRRATGSPALRAIPWQFAWMQTRLLLASWLGAEELCGAALSAADRARASRDVPRTGRSFDRSIDLLQMTLAKADPQIAADYDRRLAPADLQPLAESLRVKLAQTTQRGAGDHRAGRPAEQQRRRCAARSRCAIPTSIRSISCRSSCCGGWPRCARTQARGDRRSPLDGDARTRDGGGAQEGAQRSRSTASRPACGTQGESR